MSQQYDDYLQKHLYNVEQAEYWMVANGLISMADYVVLQERKHDASKFLPEEYNAYDDYFYGKEGKDEDDIAVIDAAFDYAWLHHIHYNPHHWQHWVLMEDEGKTKPLEMERISVYEMIADWWSFSLAKGDTKEIFKWYEEHKDKMLLHEKTRMLVEDILRRMKDILL